MHEPPQSDLAGVAVPRRPLQIGEVDLAGDEQLTKLAELLDQAKRILADIIQARRAEPRAAIADPLPAEPEHPRDDATAQHEREHQDDATAQWWTHGPAQWWTDTQPWQDHDRTAEPSLSSWECPDLEDTGKPKQ